MADDMMNELPGKMEPESFAKWSDTRAELAKAMAKAQAELGIVSKGKENSHFKSKYAELSDVLEAVLPALNAHGLSLMQVPTFNGCSVAVTSFLLHESGEWMESTLKMKPSKTDPQGVGSCITYARRYAALAIAGAAPEDDDGNAASGPSPKKDEAPRQASKANSRGLYTALQNSLRNQSSSDDLKKWGAVNASDIQSLPTDWAAEIRKEYQQELEAFQHVEKTDKERVNGHAA